MERNTVTTLGALIPGDRFYFVTDRAKVVYQRTPGHNLNKKSYNQIDSATGRKALLHDREEPNEKQVVFIRKGNL